MKRFWLVWRETGVSGDDRWTCHQYATLELAKEAAERLAGQYCNEKFYVARVVGYVQTSKPPVHWTEYS